MILRKVFSFLRPFVTNIIGSSLFNLAYAVFNILTVLSFLPVLSILFKTNHQTFEKPVYKGISNAFDFLKNTFYYEISNHAEKNGVIITLFIVCVICAGLFFFKNLFRFLASYQLAILNHGMVNGLQRALYQKIISLPLGYFSHQRKGDLMSRSTIDIQVVQDSYLTTLESMFRDPITVIVTLLMMFSMSVQLTLFVFVMLPISGLLIAQLSKKLKADSIKAQKEGGRFLSLIEETLGGLSVVKTFRAEKRMLKRFDTSINYFRMLSTNVSKRQGLASPMSEFLGALTIISVLWFGGSLVLTAHSSLDAPTFFTYIGLFYSVLNPVKTLAGTIAKVQKGNAAAGRIFEVLETKNTIRTPNDAVEKIDFEKNIRFENITFKYESDFIFKDFSLEIKKGETIALVGASGSGKSTLSHLMMRFYDLSKGRICIDGIDIQRMKNTSLRNLIGMVSQESILFNDSIAENIGFAVENPTLEAVKKAAKIAYADEFINTFPEKYHTNIGDGGNKLSGGQKQRISIARAVLKNAPIMVFDEATSALDTQSEQAVQKALEKMTENRTVLIIAHRLSTIQNADRIIVLERGKIVEQGSHEKLMTQKNTYYTMVSMQQFR